MASERTQRQIDRLLDEAEEAITKEDWSTVASRARAVLRLDPENADALSYLAAADRDTTQPAQASPAPSPVSTPVPGNGESLLKKRPAKKKSSLPSDLVIGFKCNCGHEWVPSRPQRIVSRVMRVQLPRVCPNCNSPDWNKPPKEYKGKY